MRRLLILLSVCLPLNVQAEEKKPGTPQEFVSRYCLDCHDEATAEGNVSLEPLSTQPLAAGFETWVNVLKQVERGNMPPADVDQPSKDERQALVRHLEIQLASLAKEQLPPSVTVLRRLNRSEYRNTARDLLKVNLSGVDPTRDFPDDQRSHGFPGNGEQLVTSSFLMRQYVEAADELISRAVHFEPQPEVQSWDLKPPFDKTTKGYPMGESRYFQKVLKIDPPYQTIHERTRGNPEGGYHPVDDLRDGVPVSGWYNIRIRAEAKFRYANLSLKTRFPLLWDARQPLRLLLCTGTLKGIDPENKEALDFAATYRQSGQRTLALWDLPDDEPVWLECRVWLDAGEFLRLAFPNGPSNANYRIQNYFLDHKEELLTKEQLEKFEEDFKRSGHWNIPMWFESPRIRISRIQVEGPLNDTWPPESHRAIFGDQKYQPADAEHVLHRFAERAWRHPVSVDEIAPIVQLVRNSEAQGQSPEEAIQQGLQAILCAPGFIYREEQGEHLTDYEIASRLSYFLWGSMPDDRLFELAREGKLQDPATIRQEAERMLEDPRSVAFEESFLDGWLRLHKLGSMAPDVRKFSAYYYDHLEPAMRQETLLWFRKILNNNEPISQFLDSETIIVNEGLAKLYGIDEETFEKFLGQPVPGLSEDDLIVDGEGNAPSISFAEIPIEDPRRGGLLGQGAVLTLTANGVDTSPVIRGIWVLENILGAPPNPPPPNVPVIEPDIRGATTIREQLVKHRESAACASCHRQIDPPGFALENFDAIGKWRGHYIVGKKALEIDASGQLGDREFTDIVEFKKCILERQDQFAKCLVEKLLIYGLGRELTVADAPAVRKIVDQAAPENYRLRDLVLLCLESDLFRSK